MRNEFNKYCAEVMGYEERNLRGFGKEILFYILSDKPIMPIKNYNPYDDLNQMAEVFDKLLSNFMEHDNFPEWASFLGDLSFNKGAKKSMRNFIISTMPNKPT